MAACSEKACPYPATPSGRCLQHQREHANLRPQPVKTNAGALEDAKWFAEQGKRKPAIDRAKYAAHPPQWSYVSADELEVSAQAKPRWIWLEKAIAELPKGRALRIEVPEGETVGHFRSLMSSALQSAKRTKDWRISTRTALDRTYVAIFKLGLWPESVARMELEGGEWCRLLDLTTPVAEE